MKSKFLETLSHGNRVAELRSYHGMFSKMFMLFFPDKNSEHFFGYQAEAHKFYNEATKPQLKETI